MDIFTFLSLLHQYLSIYWPEQLDSTLKPKDSANCEACRNSDYDFIIVGAGAAGCVMANRLSANPNWNVLLIEAGDDEDWITDTPALTEAIQVYTKYVWNDTTTQQSAVCADTQGHCNFIQAHVMGGGSTIGGMGYIRGNRESYDEWERLGNTGWNYTRMLYYAKKAEDMLIPQYATDTEYHSTKGPLPIAYGLYNNSILEHDYQVAQDIGLPITDYNGAQQIAFAYAQLNLLGPTRCSSSKAYLNTIKNRTNLVIFKNTYSIQILINNLTKQATGVRCLINGVEYNINATKEVILSSGAIGTPKQLMLSGIGPREHLEEMDIPVIADLPVGKNLKDPPLIRMTYQVHSTELDYDVKHLTDIIKQYAKYKQGLLTTPTGQLLGIFNSTDIYNVNTLPDVVFLHQYLLPPLSLIKSPSLAVMVNFIVPKSFGNVRLRSRNYSDRPLINPNYFSFKQDLQYITRQMIVTDNLFKKYTLAEYKPKLNIPTKCSYNGEINEDFVKCFIQYNAYSGVNAFGTVRMGPISDINSVVDPYLKVHNIKSLRVVDSSVIPQTPRAPPYATVTIMAEALADMIITDYQ